MLRTRLRRRGDCDVACRLSRVRSFSAWSILSSNFNFLSLIRSISSVCWNFLFSEKRADSDSRRSFRRSIAFWGFFLAATDDLEALALARPRSRPETATGALGLFVCFGGFAGAGVDSEMSDPFSCSQYRTGAQREGVLTLGST